MPNQRIRGNQITDQRTIVQNEHEERADAKRVTPVDKNGEFQDAANPAPVLESFIRDGAPQQVIEDTQNPANNRPLPVKLTGFEGDVIINSDNLNLETQSDGEYRAENQTPDSIGVIAHERSEVTDKTKQTLRPTAIRGDVDTDTVSQDVALHDFKGNGYDPKNPVPTSSAYEKFFNLIVSSSWLKLATFDEVVPSFVGDNMTLAFKESGAIIGRAFVTNYPSQTGWSLRLERYINNADGEILLDDDDTPLILD